MLIAHLKEVAPEAIEDGAEEKVRLRSGGMCHGTRVELGRIRAIDSMTGFRVGRSLVAVANGRCCPAWENSEFRDTASVGGIIPTHEMAFIDIYINEVQLPSLE